MSHLDRPTIDLASQAWSICERPSWGQIIDLSTEGVPAEERFSFWRDSVLRRMEPTRTSDDGRPFRARLRRVLGAGTEVVEHASDSIAAIRTASRCKQDGCDDISIDLMVNCQRASLEHGSGERRIRAGDLWIVDYARPVRVVRSRHRAAALILSRSRVEDVLGSDLTALPALRPSSSGIWALVQSQVKMILDEAHNLSGHQRILAMSGAADMALAALQSECRGKVDGERLADGFHRAAHLFIERECSDPHLTPDSVVLSLGCSRASLYRVFLRHGESISAAIWEARLSRALLLLGSSSNRHLSIAEIAFRSGFVEQTSFSRMFKRRFSVTPRDAREHRALHAPREDHRSSSQGQAKIENVVRTTSGLRQR